MDVVLARSPRSGQLAQAMRVLRSSLVAAVARKALPAALVLSGCGTSGGDRPTKTPARAEPQAPRDDARVRALGSVRLATVPQGTYGPYVADSASGGAAVWAESDGSARRWRCRAFDVAGRPLGEASSLGEAPAQVGLAIVEPRGTKSSDGYVLLYSTPDGEAQRIEARLIGADCKPRGDVVSLSEPRSDVLWLDTVVTARGALALWAVKSGAQADLYAALVGAEAAPTGVAKGARAWQAASFGDGAALGFVASEDAASPGGSVKLSLVDAVGAVKSTTNVSDSPSAEPELDMVVSGGKLLFAWGDHRDLESRIYTSRVDGHGKVERPPSPFGHDLGEQALVRLVAPSRGRGPAYLAWESLSARPSSGRAISIAALAENGDANDSVVRLLHASADSVPELVAKPDGLAALALGPACGKAEDCAAAPLVPTYVELGADLGVKVSAPVQLTALGGEAPDLAWGLACPGTTCRLLAAQVVVPAPVYLVSLDGSRSGHRPIAERMGPSAPPRGVASEILASVDPLAAVSLARSGTTPLAAWVTEFDPTTPWQRLTKPASDGRFDPPRALLQVRSLAAVPGARSPAAETLSIRARSAGGVALAAGSSGETLVGWTALDFKLPQVFVTVVDDKGKKLRQRMLTRAAGEKSDVAAVGVGDGWLLAWVDERSKDPEVYSARLNRQLQNAGPEKRITNSAGNASDVALLSRKDGAWVAWSDARDASRPGWGDIYVAKLAGADASLSGSEQIVAKTPLHSRSPALAAFGKGAVVAWIEEAPVAAGGSGEAEAKLALLDEDARPIGSSTAIRPKRGVPSSVALDCSADACRVVLGVTDGERSELLAFSWSEAGAGEPKPLLALSGSASGSLAPALLDRDLVFADQSGREGRVRRLTVEWK